MYVKNSKGKIPHCMGDKCFTPQDRKIGESKSSN
jgi:hypothetical protein